MSEHRLQEIRKENGLTQQALAERLNVPLRRYRTWENEEVRFLFSDACDVCNYFGITLDSMRPGHKTEKAAIHEDNSLISYLSTLDQEKLDSLQATLEIVTELSPKKVNNHEH